MDYRDFELAPGIREFLAEGDAFSPPKSEALSVAEQRRYYDALCRHFDNGRPEGVTVEELSIPAGDRPVPLRLYRPAASGPLPAALFLHGGGWVLGGLDSHDSVAAELAAGAGCAVLAVDYRLAPEHPWPAAFEDAWAALLWLAGESAALDLDGQRLAVAGDSAGGQLAAALALKAREAGGPALAGQVLIYPALGLELAEPTRARAPDGPGLTHADMAYYRRALFGGEAGAAAAQSDPFAHPLLAAGFSDLPPAVIVAAEHDPLRDDAAVYAERLAAAGVPAEHRCFAGLIHGCLRALHRSPAADELFGTVVTGLRRLLAAG